jgi:hypothetical protein
MSINEAIMTHPHDHIMANTWRLIFEGKNSASQAASTTQTDIDFSTLEQLLPEYRLIGFILASTKERRHD